MVWKTSSQVWQIGISKPDILDKEQRLIIKPGYNPLTILYHVVYATMG